MMKSLPSWLKRPMPFDALEKMNNLLKELSLHTVCQSARCPNIGECFSSGEATFMILGNACTRNCSFCSVKSNEKPAPLDPDEPNRIAEAVKRLGLDYAVITSVTRDDLPDGGAGAFAKTAKAIRQVNPYCDIEVLTPDLNRNWQALDIIAGAPISVFAHNIETVPGLYNKIRPQADYENCLSILQYFRIKYDIFTKSGIILGLGEKTSEVISVMKDLKSVGCDIITLGQYLKPSKECVEIEEFISPDLFEYYRQKAEELEFLSVSSGPFVRSSYRAGKLWQEAVDKGAPKNEYSFTGDSRRSE